MKVEDLDSKLQEEYKRIFEESIGQAKDLFLEIADFMMKARVIEDKIENENLNIEGADAFNMVLVAGYLKKALNASKGIGNV